MNSIRRNKRAVRIPFIILVVALSVGLVGYFAVGAAPVPKGGQGTYQQPVAPNAQAQGQQQAQPGGQASPELQRNTQIQQYEAVLRSNPDNAPILKELGDARYELAIFYASSNRQADANSNWQKAIEAYGKYLEKDSKNVNVRVDRATAAFYGGQNDLAEKEFKQAIADDPKHVNAHFNYGVFLVTAKKDTTAALKEWQAVVDLKPGAEAEKKAQDMISQYKGK